VAGVFTQVSAGTARQIAGALTGTADSEAETHGMVDVSFKRRWRFYSASRKRRAVIVSGAAQQLSNDIRVSPLRFSGVRADGEARWDFSAIKRFRVKEKGGPPARIAGCEPTYL
jgi:hypothetical protein